MLELGPVALKRELLSKLARVRELARNLKAENDAYIASMPFEVNEIMAGKHIKLFEDLAKLSDIADPVLIDGLRN
eukprot:1713428-Amphidinium_carterae.1